MKKIIMFMFIALLTFPLVLGSIEVQSENTDLGGFEGIVQDEIGASEERIIAHIDDESQRCINLVEEKANGYAEEKIKDFKHYFYFEKFLTIMGVFVAVLLSLLSYKLILLFFERKDRSSDKK